MSMDEVRGYLAMVTGMAEMSRARATELAQGFVTFASRATPAELATFGTALAEDLLESAKVSSEMIARMVRTEVAEAIENSSALARVGDLEAVRMLVGQLQAQLESVTGRTAQDLLPAPAVAGLAAADLTARTRPHTSATVRPSRRRSESAAAGPATLDGPGPSAGETGEGSDLAELYDDSGPGQGSATPQEFAALDDLAGPQPAPSQRTAERTPAGRNAAQRAPASKRPAEKTTAKQAATKTTAANTGAKKAATKKAAAKQTTAKKTTAKKSAAKTTSTKKAAAKRTTAKQTATKTTSTKKAAAKRTATKSPGSPTGPAR